MRLCLQRCVAPLAALFLAASVSLRADISLPGSISPQADAAQAQVRRGQSVTIGLRGHYGGAGTLSFVIVKSPQHGKLFALSLLSDNRATILYENEGAEGATVEGFAYVVKGGGHVSAPAEVRIAVEEAPAEMQIPAKLEFGSIMAGDSAIRQLRITNEGGGVLAGRLTVSDPWTRGVSEYQIGAGRTESVPVTFRPNEARSFVGLLTLSGPGGEISTVALEGAATSPLTVEPAQLPIGPAANELRAGSLALTNRTARPLHLKVEAGPSIRPVDDLVPRTRSETTDRDRGPGGPGNIRVRADRAGRGGLSAAGDY